MSTTTLPVSPQKAPYGVSVTEGQKIFWCSCGLSQNQPYCDGSHKGTEMKPFHYVPETSGQVYLCGCKHTKNPPFCDGTHSQLG